MPTPSEYFRKPVIGTVTTKKMELTSKAEDGTEKPLILEPETYEVIDRVEIGGDRKPAFVANFWSKEYKHEPLVVMEYLVDTFVPCEKMGGV